MTQIYPSRIAVFLCAAALCASGHAAELKQKTTTAFDRYVAATEARFANELRPDGPFLYIDAMNADAGVTLTALKVDGSMVSNELLMQFQADVLDVPVIRPTVAETTSLGAAYAAGLTAGYWDEVYELRSNWRWDREWTPAMSSQERERGYRRWKKAVQRTLDWEDEDD